jgi:hypothetical protein
MMSCRALAWESSEIGDRLTPVEVAELVDCTQQLASLGALTDGKYIGASRALYWQRIQKEN